MKLPRSILKPTISALPEIPPLKKTGKGASKTTGERDSTATPSSSSEDLGSKIAVRTEEEQQAASREREERERRDARRKSLANRRVSFAAEATLHTFHEVEYMQDSTTSTDSSRRASSAAGRPPNDAPAAQREEALQSQVDSATELPSQGELHQRKFRRSSGLPPIAFGPADDDTLASTIYSSDSEPADAVEEIEEEEIEGSSSESDDGTMMTMEEVTGTTVASERSAGEAEDSTLDEALRIAAHRAGMQNLGSEQDQDDSDDGEEIIPSFGWVKKPVQSDGTVGPDNAAQKPQEGHSDESGGDTAMDMDIDMDMTSAVGGILKPLNGNETDAEGDMSMDVTRAFGGILLQKKVVNDAPTLSHEADPAVDEVTMELTTALGGICRLDDDDDIDDNEEMSMELTSVMGGVLSQFREKKATTSRRRTLNRRPETDFSEATMDMTAVAGRILPTSDSENNAAAGDATVDIDITAVVGRILPVPDSDDNDAGGRDATMGMDMTAAIGGIISRGEASSRTLAKRIMEEEADGPNNPKGAIAAAVSKKPPLRRSSRNSLHAEAPLAPESPVLSLLQDKSQRRSIGPKPQNQTQSPLRPEASPRKGAISRTPSLAKVETPRQKTPTPSKLQTRSKSPGVASPAQQNSQNANRTPSPAKAKAHRTSLFFQNDTKTGSRTPTVTLTPQKREMSGLGADRPGIGSPQVAALCDRRGSIGEAAVEFVPGKRAVTFEDPKQMEEELDKERQDEEDKENRRRILEREADGSQEDKDATFNLREMIDSLSPKRNPLKGRKSLHIGSARGLLGKRPAELDEEAEDNDGVKRLKGHQGSPVKNVRLQQPPSKAETTGRRTRSARRSLEQGANNVTPSLSPLKESSATTPRHQGRFKDVKDNQTAHEVKFHDSNARDDAELVEEADEGRIHLQDFLNMTSIRFMELTTTKRRHTVAPGSLQDGSTADGHDSMSLERCVVAGACTVPMLELYQHSCRELKKYISEGRRMVKEIESDTFDDNPPLFREYMSATPDVKALMDNQFKNVKTHARLLSKAMWYEWRMKLQDGLKEGLCSIAQGMESDDKMLRQQQDLLDSVLPGMVKRYEALKQEKDNLEEAARELADCDPSELKAARDELASVEADMARKKQAIAELRTELEGSTAEVEALTTKKQHCLEGLEKSEKIREECRGWTSSEVNALRGKHAPRRVSLPHAGRCRF